MGRMPVDRILPRVLLALAMVMALAACGRASQPMGPATTTPELYDDHVIAADGYQLPMRHWPAAGETRAVVLAVHGFDDYSNAFAGAAPVWAGHGIATYAYDQRGFGATQRPGIWAGTETLLADLRAVSALVRAREPGVPFYLLGESMGGGLVLLALSRAEAPPVDGAILVAPATWAEELMPFYQQWALWLSRNLWPGLELTGEGLDIQPTDNPETLRQLSEDPLVLKSNRVDTIAGLVDLMSDAYAESDRLATRSLVMFGDNEEVLAPEAVDALLSRLQPGVPVIARYPEGWHLLLRDLNGRIVVDDIAAWITDPKAPLPSGADRRAPEGP